VLVEATERGEEDDDGYEQTPQKQRRRLSLAKAVGVPPTSLPTRFHQQLVVRDGRFFVARGTRTYRTQHVAVHCRIRSDFEKFSE
jgi:hypothetical protein